MPQTFSVVVKDTPLSTALRSEVFPHGLSISEILHRLDIRDEYFDLLRVAVGGIVVRQELYPYIRPHPSSFVSVLVVPGQSGGASVVPKDTLRLVMGLASAAAGAGIPAALGIGGFGATAIGLGVTAVGTLATNALIPPPLEPDGKRYSFSGSENRVDPYGVVPKVIGTFRSVPPLIGSPRTELVGNDEYLRTGYLIGYGPLELSDFRLGSTPVPEYAGEPGETLDVGRNLIDYGDLEIQVREGKTTDLPLTLFTDDIWQEFFGSTKKLEYAEDWDSTKVQYAQTAGSVDEISVDISFPSGLGVKQNDSMAPYAVQFGIQYRLLGSTKWIDVPVIDIDELNAEIEANEEGYYWNKIDEVLTNLEDLLDDLEFAFSYTADWQAEATWLVNIQTIADTIRDIVDSLNPTTSSQETTLSAIVDAIDELLDKLVGFTVGEVLSDAFQNWVDDMSATIPLLKAILEANEVLQRGYTTEDIVIRNPWVRFWIARQGLTSIFEPLDDTKITIIDKNPGLVRRGIRWPVEHGAYEVRVRRITEEEEADIFLEDAYWSMFRSIRFTEGSIPHRIDQAASAAIRVKAQENMSGSLPRFSCLASSKARAWSAGAGWTEYSTSYGSNPAWAALDVLLGRENPSPVNEDRLDLSTWKDFADFCDTEGFEVNTIIEDETTVYELVTNILSVGRGALSFRDGKISVIWDREQTTPRQLFTPKNIISFESSKEFQEPVHGFRVTFINPKVDWQQDEYIVYNDGYAEAADKDNEEATNIEPLDLWGVVDTPTDPSHDYYTGMVWKLGRYFLAVNKLRKEEFTIKTDIENLHCVRGDRVMIMHDVIMVGHYAARIEAKTVNTDGTLDSITVEEDVVMESGKTYSCRLRKNTGEIVSADLVTMAGESNTLVFDPSLADAASYSVGDLVVWGETDSVVFDALVKEIRYGRNMEATLTCVPYVEGIYTADEEEIPDSDSHIIGPPPTLEIAPPKPTIESLISDETVLTRNVDGSLDANIQVTLDTPPGGVRPNADYTEVQYRLSIGTAYNEPDSYKELGEPEWLTSSRISAKVTRIRVGPVTSGVYYDVRVRYITREGTTSEWAYETDHYVVGKTSAPPSITTLLYNNGVVYWDYPNAPLDLAGFKVRFAYGEGDDLTWESATPAHAGVISDTHFRFQENQDGPRFVAVKAVDTSGNESDDAASVLLDLGELRWQNIVSEYDYKANDWPGTIENGTIDAGTNQIEATTTGGVFWPPKNQPFWRDVSDLFWDNEYARMEYFFTLAVSSADAPCTVRLEYTISAGTYEILFRPEEADDVLWPGNLSEYIWPEDMDDNFWPEGAAYRPWPGALEVLEETALEFKIITYQGQTQSAISELTAIKDVPDLQESYEDESISAGGTTVTLTKPFRHITGVFVDIQYASGRTAEGYVVDKSLTPGPTIYLLDNAGNETTGLADIIVQGY